MDFSFNQEDEAFRAEARSWLTAELEGPFAHVRGRGGPGDEHALYDERLAWERRLGEAGWTCVGWPTEHGGRGLSLYQQVIWFEEYARAGGPGRLGHIGETLAGPTIIAFGTPDQQRRFLPGIVAGTELWAQGYSEPNAGSDLANVQTRAERDGDEWVISGQKVWTSLAHWAQWAFVLCRTDRDAPKHKGISYLLVPLDQPGVEIRPIRQVTGTSEFNEVFFEGARTPVSNTVGEANGGWKVAMGTLAFERGASTLGQQLEFDNQLRHVVDTAKANGRIADPAIRQRLAAAWAGLRIMRWNTLRVLSAAGAELPREAMVTKLYWANWHRDLGNLAMDVLGTRGMLMDYETDDAEAVGDAAQSARRSSAGGESRMAEPARQGEAAADAEAVGDAAQSARRSSAGGESRMAEPARQGEAAADAQSTRLFLFTRSDTIYAGSNQIQRNIIGERALGLPPEPKV